MSVSDIKDIFIDCFTEFLRQNTSSTSMGAEKPLKASELAKALDVSIATISVWENQGLLPARWISNRKFYLLSEVNAAMKLDPRFERKNTLRKKTSALSTIS
ncbi:hypothetical protein QNI16_12540 [Cytophagaceae bacterium YF14B1]|uniref:Uncharacterized protein n=1 Tax=Xanthocytophaga flava TaxID=3048013 RepID=A0AAE3QL18_9BACT|nr:hypothetical protein [Xanthocytophaga flavus]MDJ1481317.1 hypothetical protein [Xanthocytophaga flavus]